MKPIACFLLFVLTLPAVAQHRENVTVEVIEVPVYVIGPDGQPVRGLTKDAFDLRVNGRHQPIEFFDAFDYASNGGQPATPVQTETRSARERRLYLLLFDLFSSNLNQVHRARQAAEYVVDHSESPADYFAVATYTSNKGVQFVTAFLNDHIALKRAIATLRPSELKEPLELATSAGERAAFAAQTSERDLRADAELSSTLTGGAAFQDLLGDQMRHFIDDELADFGDLAARLAGLEGQKHVVWLSTGFNAALIHGGPRATPKNVTSGGGLDAHSIRVLDDMAHVFESAGVFLDSVDVAGLRMQSDNEGLQMVSDATGGQFVHNRNDLGNALVDMQNNQSVVYLLGFHRRNAKSGEISVRVNGVPRGTRLSYRQGFGKFSHAATVDPLQLADIIVNDVPQTGVRMRVDREARDIVVTLAKNDVMPQLAPKSPFVDVVLYVFDANGAAVLTENVRVDARADPLVVRKTLDLPAGVYVAKAVANVTGTTATGFARAEFTVP